MAIFTVSLSRGDDAATRIDNQKRSYQSDDERFLPLLSVSPPFLFIPDFIVFAKY
jgi:hypothetical protein